MINEDWMISDLHIHSRFSRACSKNIDFDNLVKWAKIKGIDLLGTGDFTHPVWINEIKEKLSKFKPLSLGQASRVSGVTPTAIALLMAKLRSVSKVKGKHYA